MGRKRVILQSEFPYNVSARCINREWFFLPMPVVWEIFCRELERTRVKHGWRIHLFVLMSNHYHFVVSTPRANISQCMHQFMTNTSRRLNLRGNRINETFAGRHYKCILGDPAYYLNAYKYNYRNPVNAGICRRAEDYPFSSLHGQVGRSKLIFELEEDTTFTFDPEGTLNWVNTMPDKEKLRAMRIGLKRQYFKSILGRDRKPILGPGVRL